VNPYPLFDEAGTPAVQRPTNNSGNLPLDECEVKLQALSEPLTFRFFSEVEPNYTNSGPLEDRLSVNLLTFFVPFSPLSIPQLFHKE